MIIPCKMLNNLIERIARGYCKELVFNLLELDQ